MKQAIASKIKFFIKAGVAALLIFFVFRSGHLRLESLKNLLTPTNLVVLFSLLGLNLWLLNWRWYWLLHSRGFPVTIRNTFSLYLIGVFFNHALPSSVGGDIVKAYYIARDHSHRRVDAVLSVLIDRALGLYSMLLLPLFGALWDYSFVRSHAEVRVMAALCGALVAGMTVAFSIGFSKRMDRLFGVSAWLRRMPRLHLVAKVFGAMQVYGELRWTILISVLVSLVAQMVSVGFFVYVTKALGMPELSLSGYVFCVPLGFVAMALPIAPAGVGVGQVALLFLFQAYAPGSGDAGSVGITAFQVAMLAWGLIGSLFYVWYRKPMELKA